MLSSGTDLYLRGWRLEAARARLLADDPRFIKVRTLDLSGNQIGDEGLGALPSEAWRGLGDPRQGDRIDLSGPVVASRVT